MGCFNQKLCYCAIRTAAKALYTVTNNLFTANQKIVKWTNEFELLDLEQDENSRKEFQKFAGKYKEFRAGPEYDSLKISCHEIDAVYENNLKGQIKEFLSRDKEKYDESTKLFRDLKESDGAAENFVNYVTSKLSDGIMDIKNDYKNTKTIRDRVVGDLDIHTNELENQIDKLRNLRGEFFKIAKTQVTGQLRDHSPNIQD